jgi:hypothetical protein
MSESTSIRGLACSPCAATPANSWPRGPVSRELEIYAKAPDEFFWKVVSAEIKFVTDKDGNVEKAIHEQGGATMEVKKTE